jgi:hypothetical protein
MYAISFVGFLRFSVTPDTSRGPPFGGLKPAAEITLGAMDLSMLPSTPYITSRRHGGGTYYHGHAFAPGRHFGAGALTKSPPRWCRVHEAPPVLPVRR